MPVAALKRSSSPASSPPPIASEWSAKQQQQQQQCYYMASPRSVVKVVSLLLLFAVSGTILQNFLAWGPRDEDESPSPAKNPNPRHRSTEFRNPKTPVAAADSIFLSSRLESRSSVSSSCQILDRGADPVLRVFLYDLPPEFHFAMLNSSAIDQESYPWPRNLSSLPRYPGGLNQQHSPEYWLTADLLSSSDPASRDTPCSAVRVADPALADVFFVPFFASLSYNRYCRKENGKRQCGKNDVLEHRLVEFLKGQESWARNSGVDHVVVMHHPNSLMVARGLIREAMFVVADFGRFSQSVANLNKDVVAPYKHVIPTFVDDSSSFESRQTLLFFQGAIVRKEGGIIRQQLYDLLKDRPGVYFATGSTARDNIRKATTGMRNSKFCLHLAGDTPSARLFDAIVSHCVPVVVSDEIELPFEDELDYSEFCVFVESEKALREGYLMKVLGSIDREEWTRMWETLKRVERHFEYQFPSMPEDAVQMTWREIAKRVPSLRFKAHKSHRFDTKAHR